MGAEQYGRYFWGIKLADGSTVMANADTVVLEDGALILASVKTPTLIYAPGQWERVWAASVMTGAAVAVDGVYETE